MKILRVIFWLAAAGLLAYAATLRGAVHNLGNGEAREITASSFNEAATVDSLLRKDGKLYDRNSLAPEKANLKDCPT